MTPGSDQRPDPSRRAFVTRAAYVAPAIITLAAAPSYAKAGSEKPRETRDFHDDDRPKRPRSRPKPVGGKTGPGR